MASALKRPSVARGTRRPDAVRLMGLAAGLRGDARALGDRLGVDARRARPSSKIDVTASAARRDTGPPVGAAPGVGRPAIGPEAAARLMSAGLLRGVVHARRPMREAHANLAVRRCAGFGPNRRLPDAEAPRATSGRNRRLEPSGPGARAAAPVQARRAA